MTVDTTFTLDYIERTITQSDAPALWIHDYNRLGGVDAGKSCARNFKAYTDASSSLIPSPYITAYSYQNTPSSFVMVCDGSVNH